MTIRSRVATDAYRWEWERIFGPRGLEYAEKTGRCPPTQEMQDDCLYPSALNPHDATEHPKAD